MDYNDIQELRPIVEEQIKRAREYATCRTKAAEAKKNLDILLAAKFLKFRTAKKNVGYETSLIMLMEDSEEARDLYKTMIANEAKYKSLEKIIEALQSKISLGQSIMRYTKENT